MRFISVLENCIRQPVRYLSQIISLIIMGTLARSLQLHIKVVMEILMPLMVACDFLANVCSAVNLSLLPLKLSYDINLRYQSKPLTTTAPPQLICNQGAVNGIDHFLQCIIFSSYTGIIHSLEKKQGSLLPTVTIYRKAFICVVHAIILVPLELG